MGPSHWEVRKGAATRSSENLEQMQMAALAPACSHLGEMGVMKLLYRNYK